MFVPKITAVFRNVIMTATCSWPNTHIAMPEEAPIKSLPIQP